jgi:valyl-tRNA synthetase
MPFLTEELWQKLPGVSSRLHNGAYKNAESTIMLADFPMGEEATDATAEFEMQLIIELISKVRNIRSELNIKPSEKVLVHVSASAEIGRVFSSNETQILKLARAAMLSVSESLEVPKASAKAVLSGGAEVAVPLEGLIDFDKETDRLRGQVEKLQTELERLAGQLSNKNFVEKAPQEKVDALRERQAELEQQLQTLHGNLAAIEA